MKRPLIAAAACLAALSAPVMAADVGVSITIGQPGFYGHIDIGDFPPPVLVYPQPVVIHHVPVASHQPLYLRVPPGHYKHWSKHCAQYNACGHPVYFVQDSWYNDVYAPRYRERHGNVRGGDRNRYEWRGHDEGKGKGDRGEGRGNGKGRGHDNDQGRGQGHGKGRGD